MSGTDVSKIQNNPFVQKTTDAPGASPIQKTGTPVFGIEIINDEPNQENVEFYPDGTIKSKTVYDEKGRIKTIKTFDAEGKAETLQNYEYTDENVTSGFYDIKNGKRMVETRYLDGTLQYCTENDKNAGTAAVSLYVDDKFRSSMHENGSERNFFSFNENGELTSEVIEKKDETIMRSYYENGNLSHTQIKDKNGWTERTYMDDGSMAYERVANKDGMIDVKLRNNDGELESSVETTYTEKGYKKITHEKIQYGDIGTVDVTYEEIVENGNRTVVNHDKDGSYVSFEHKVTENGYVEKSFNPDGSISMEIIVDGENEVNYDSKNDQKIVTYQKTVTPDGEILEVRRDMYGKLAPVYEKTITQDGSVENYYRDNELYEKVTTSGNHSTKERYYTDKAPRVVFEQVKSENGDAVEKYYNSGGNLENVTERIGNGDSVTRYDENGEIIYKRESFTNSTKIMSNVNGKLETIIDMKREDIDDNHYVTTNNVVSHEVEFSDKEITIKNANTGEINKIDLEKMLSALPEEDRADYLETLKGLSGENLVDLSFEADKIYDTTYAQSESYAGVYNHTSDIIQTDKSTGTLSHELGHAVDFSQAINSSSIEQNKEFEAVYQEEMTSFLQKYPAGREGTDLNDGVNNVSRRFYALTNKKEMFAESYTLLALGKSYSADVIVQHFPKTFEAAKKHLEYIRSLPPEERH